MQCPESKLKLHKMYIITFCLNAETKGLFIVWKLLENMYFCSNISLREEERISPETILKGETKAPFWLHLMGVQFLQLKATEAKNKQWLILSKEGQIV